jgi:hypothetical protein
MLIAALYTTAKKQKQLKHLLIDEWIKKTGYIHTMKHYSVTKVKDILLFVATWIELEIIK